MWTHHSLHVPTPSVMSNYWTWEFGGSFCLHIFAVAKSKFAVIITPQPLGEAFKGKATYFKLDDRFRPGKHLFWRSIKRLFLLLTSSISGNWFSTRNTAWWQPGWLGKTQTTSIGPWSSPFSWCNSYLVAFSAARNSILMLVSWFWSPFVE